MVRPPPLLPQCHGDGHILSTPPCPPSCRCGATLSLPQATTQDKGRGARGRAAPPLLPRSHGALAAVAPPGFSAPHFQPLPYPPHSVYVGAKPRASPYPLPALHPDGFSYGQQ